MKKLIKGILDFRNHSSPEYKAKFAKLAVGQSPDSLFVACSDSRVAANAFASTDPGDLFVIRNVGNMIPICNEMGTSVSDKSEAAALEFALVKLDVTSIIICGHSECGAMQALIEQDEASLPPNLRDWLMNGRDSLEALKTNADFAPELSAQNRLSQLNVLRQIEHLKLYPVVQEKLDAGKLTLHAWWFELQTASVYTFDDEVGRFVILDEPVAAKLLEQISHCP